MLNGGSFWIPSAISNRYTTKPPTDVFTKKILSKIIFGQYVTKASDSFFYSTGGMRSIAINCIFYAYDRFRLHIVYMATQG